MSVFLYTWLSSVARYGVASFLIWARSLGRVHFLFSHFCDLGAINFSTSEFATEGITFAKDPEAAFCLKCIVQ